VRVRPVMAWACSNFLIRREWLCIRSLVWVVVRFVAGIDAMPFISR